MIVFIDTNIIYNNWHLNNANFKYLLNYLENTKSKLIISDIVCDEVDNKFRTEIQNLKKQFNEAIKRSKSLLNNSPEIDLNILEPNYSVKELFSSKTKNVIFLEYDNIPNSLIVDRAIKRIKPFQDKEKGFRDTLIWLSFIEYLKANNIEEDVAFINNNSNDFFNKEKTLFHSDLILDINRLELSNNFEVFKSLSDFIANVEVKEQYKYNFDDILEKYIYPNEDTIEADLESYLNSHTATWFGKLLKNNSEVMSGIVFLNDFELEIIEGIEDPELINLSFINDNVFFIELSFILRIVDIKLTVPTIVYKEKQDAFNIKFYDIEINDDKTTMSIIQKMSFGISYNYKLKEESINDLTINSFQSISI